MQSKTFLKALLVSAVVGFGTIAATTDPAHAAITHTTGSNLPRVDMVDVSSHNQYISVANYRQMKAEGAKAVVVKATEGTSYINPYAREQAQNADKAGLSINFYHFSHFTSTQDAINEANYFVNEVKSITSMKNVVMVNDEESTESTYCTFYQNNAFNAIFTAQLNKLGYNSTDIYSGASWFNYRLSANSANKGWVASYYNNPTGSKYSANNSWQWASDFQFAGMYGRDFDVSQNYSDKYYHTGTANASQPAQAITNGTSSSTTSRLRDGDTVYIKTSAKTYYGSNTSIPSFVKNKNYHVLSVSGNRVVIKEIMSAVNRTDLVKVQPATSAVASRYNVALTAGVHAQTGTFTPNRALTIWNHPGYSSTGVKYYSGEPIHYQGYITNGRWVYITYKAYGHWYYVACRQDGALLGSIY